MRRRMMNAMSRLALAAVLACTGCVSSAPAPVAIPLKYDLSFDAALAAAADRFARPTAARV